MSRMGFRSKFRCLPLRAAIVTVEFSSVNPARQALDLVPHTHATPDDAGCAEIADLLHAIIHDQILIFEEAGLPNWIDLRDPDALAEELTFPTSSGRASLKSWSGKADATVGLADIKTI